MSNFFARQAVAYRNEVNKSIGALVGIAQGLLADQELRDSEIHFLKKWLEENDAISTIWPGDVIYQRIESVLADGRVSASERTHLVETLRQLVGGTLDDLAASEHATELAFDEGVAVDFDGRRFCLTGDFVFGPRAVCKSVIEERGGTVGAVSKYLDFIVIGGLGSAEWKHGSFGTKLAKAMEYKSKGIPISVVSEDCWANSL